MFFWDKIKWEEHGVTESSHKFFVLRWNELFDEDTFDSWQVRTSNIKSILNEILVASDVAEKYHPSHHNIKWLIEEAKSILPKDVVIKEYYGFISHYLDEIEMSYRDKVASDKNKSIKEFVQVVKVTLGYLTTYKDKLVSRLREALRKPDNFEELYILCLNLGIELHNFGYSIESLRFGKNILLDSSELDFLTRYDNLIAQYSGKIDKYTCSFIISWRNKQQDKNPNLEDFGIRLHKDKIAPVSDAISQFYGQDKAPLIAELKVNSTDYYSARYLAEETLESVFAVNKLYQPTGTTMIKHGLALVEKEGCSHICIPPNDTRLQYVKDSRKPDKKIADYAKVYKTLSPSDKEQLSSALQYYKLFTLASADEARLTNLWIAVESLIQDGSKSIIERITTYLSATNTTNYVRLMVNFLPQNLKLVWRNTDTTSLRTHLKYSSDYYLDPYDMLAILLDDDESQLVKGLESIVSDYHLYWFRIKRLREKMYKGPGVLRGILENHFRNLEWQIHRIYRARNHVTHSGKCLPGTRHLIQNLQSYFVIAVHNLIHDLITNPEWTISSALEHRLLLYRYTLKKLEKYKQEPVSIEMLLNPHISLSMPVVTPAWKIQ